jgi:hypothetical protein
MKRRTRSRPLPPKSASRSTLTARPTHSTIGTSALGAFAKPPRRTLTPKLPPKAARPPARHIGRIVDDEESSLLDLIDNLLTKGVVLNAELILALANVDLIYVRLSALVCAADRILPMRARP